MAITYDQANKAYQTTFGRDISQNEYNQHWADADFGVERMNEINRQSQEFQNLTSDQQQAAQNYQQQYQIGDKITDAYGNILGRTEIRPEAMDFYTQQWQDQGWTQADMENVLRNSPEYQQSADVPVEEQNKTNIKDPNLPSGSEFQPVEQTATPEEMLTYEGIDPSGVSATAGQVNAPTATDPNTYQAQTTGDQTPQGEAAQGQLSEGARGEAATREDAFQQYNQTIEQARQHAQQFEIDKRATVREQYRQLMDFEAGETPSWAKGAIREAEARMASRGLGSSSMAAEAVSAAVMQAAMPIAQQDARVFQTMSMEKFNKQQQGFLMKASHLANLDMQSLNNRQQMAVQNARSFLQMDMSNLNNRQQMAVMNTQARLQTMMSDQAATNAARQFNAKSRNQVEMFYKNLQTQVEQFNAAQTTDVSKFNASMENQREQFNTKNALLVEQSNVEYLRNISTQNTAMKNQANYVNSQNLLDISNTAMANQVQLLRDREAFAHDMFESSQDRALSRWITTAKLGLQEDLANMEMWMGVGEAVGNFTGGVVGNILENWR